MYKKYKQFKVFINEHPTCVDVSLKNNGSYECLFNKMNGDFINGLGAMGFIIKESDFIIIPLFDKTILTQEIMRGIWDQIPQEQLPT